MWIGNAPRDPDDGLRFQACGKRQNLPQMHVVGVFQLVLNEHAAVVFMIAGDNVRRELPDCDFRALEVQRYSNRLGKPL